MEKVRSFLREWVIGYVRNKDVMTKKIEDVKFDEEGFDIAVKFKDKTQYFMIRPVILNIGEVTKNIEEKGSVSLVVLNNELNLGIVTEMWNTLASHRHFSIYFVNPFSSLDKQWIIYPYTHNLICDESSLKSGLRPMYEMVEPVSEDKLKEMV